MTLAIFLFAAVPLRADDANTLTAYWKDGLRFKSKNSSFKGRIRGRFHNDWIGFLSSGEQIEAAIGEQLEDGTEFRRARIGIEGTLYKRLEFEATYDFSDGETEFKDTYIGFISLPVVGNLRIGYMKEPFSLENLTSSNYTTFMERSLADAFTPGRNTGLMLHNTICDQRASWAVGVFKDSNDQGAATGDGGYHVTARLTGTPLLEHEGRHLVHLGISYSHSNADEGEVRFRARPEAHLSPRFVTTDKFEADAADLLAGEFGLVWNSLSFQGEYIHALVDSSASSDPTFFGFYGQISYFLTGEYRRYKRSKGAFKKIKPASNFLGREEGLGAWELAVRYSQIDLTDEEIVGGELHDVTVGANWYLSPTIRMMLNYIYADLDRVDQVSIAQARMQLAF